MASDDFTIDKVEYQSVFKVFDRENTGRIEIEQVNKFIQMFEDLQIKVPEETKQPKNSREIPIKNSRGMAMDKRGGTGPSHTGAASAKQTAQSASSKTGAAAHGNIGINRTNRPGPLNAKLVNQEQISAQGAQNSHSPTKRGSNNPATSSGFTLMPQPNSGNAVSSNGGNNRGGGAAGMSGSSA